MVLLAKLSNKECAAVGRLPLKTKFIKTIYYNQFIIFFSWAFSTTGNIEGVWAVKKNETVSLSEQGIIKYLNFFIFNSVYYILRIGRLRQFRQVFS